MGLARRDLLIGLAGLPLAAVLADPRLARAAAASLETVTISTAGGRSVSAALGVPAALPAPAVILVHEWWGLNDQIKSVAAALAETGYLAVAIDLYDGQVTDDPQTARGLVGAVDAGAATDTCASWVNWLRSHEDGTGKVGTVGWCFGGGWSLNASLAAPVDATVVYYGSVKKGRGRLAALGGAGARPLRHPRQVDQPSYGGRFRVRDGGGRQERREPLVRGRSRLRQPDQRPLRRGGRRPRLAAHLGLLPSPSCVRGAQPCAVRRYEALLSRGRDSKARPSRGFSSKSSASFSVMVPPSCSASVSVTARR